MPAQHDYHRALEAKYPGKFVKVLGSHVYEKDGAKMPSYVQEIPFDKDNTVRVWPLVEKKTDVNLALSMYRDVNRGILDQVVLVSYDTDTEPAINALIEDFPALKIGMIVPRGPQSSGKKGRPARAQSFFHNVNNFYFGRCKICELALKCRFNKRRFTGARCSRNQESAFRHTTFDCTLSGY